MLMIFYAGGSFCAMLLCGRLYNHIGAVILFLTGLICHAVGIIFLSWVKPDQQQLSLLIAAYLLMGIGGGITANTAQTTAMIDFEGEKLVRASTIWNLNRQISFSVGATFFTLIFNALQKHSATIDAYHICFLIGALLGLLPLLRLISLNNVSQE